MHGVIELTSPEDRDTAAGEYVLGTLGNADRDAFESALAHDATLNAAVYAWQDRLLALSVRAPSVRPTPQLWARVARAVESTPTRVAPTARSGAEPESVAPRAARPAPAVARWWRRPAAPWQFVSGLALAATLFLAVLLVVRPLDAPTTRYLALLQSPQDRSTGWIVEIESNGEMRLVPVGAPTAAPAGRSMQFWTKPKDAAAPTSLGLVQAGQTLRLPVSRLPAVGVEQLFEITVEPLQGSPTGRPTGPILYVGRTLTL